MQVAAGSLPPGAEREGVALVALDVTWRIEIVVVARCDVLVGQQIGDVETNDLSRVIVGCGSFDALKESWDKTKISSARESQDTVKRPNGNATPNEAVVFSFVNFDVTVACQ